MGTPSISERFGVPLVELHGLEFLNVDEPRCVELLIDEARAGRGGWVVTPNTDIVRHCDHDPELLEMVRSADVRIADGMPLVWASHVQRTPLRGRVCGSDLMLSIPEAAAPARLSLYLLGGKDGSEEQTARILQARHPSLKIAGAYSPPFGFEKDPEHVERIATMVAEAEPSFVFVALGFPKGERLIHRIRHRAPQAWWLGVGAAFDFVSGNIKRAPEWMQDTGTEWVYRISQDPKRLAERYLVHDLPFAATLFSRSIRRRFGKG